MPFLSQPLVLRLGAAAAGAARRRGPALAAGCALAGLLAAGAGAAEIRVTNGTSAVGDGDGCSLVEAILNANGDDQSGSTDCAAGSGADEVVLDVDILLNVPAPGVDPGAGPSGTPTVTAALTVRAGAASAIERDPPAPPFRILHARPPGELTLQGLRIAGGRIVTVDQDARGGCILAVTRLRILDSEIEGCTAVATVEDFAGPVGAFGGAIDVTGPELVLRRSAIRDSTAIAGDAAVAGADGGSAGGGGIAVTLPFAGLEVLIEDVELTGNSAVAGNGGGQGGEGGNAFGGGAMLLTDPVVRRVAATGNTAFGGTGSFGGAGFGGGMFVSGIEGGEPVRVEASAFVGNSASGPDPTVILAGGGLAVVVPAGPGLEVASSTFSGNALAGGPALGGGLGLLDAGGFDGEAVLDSVTVTGSGGSGLGSAVEVTVRNSVIAAQASGPDCLLVAPLIPDGPNLASDGTCTGFSIPSADPLLAPLAVHPPGTTPTHEPQPGSPAIDAGATELPTDQRGVARPQGSGDDLGAHEVGGPLPPEIFADGFESGDVSAWSSSADG